MGIVSKLIQWITHPSYHDSDPVDWFAGFIVVLLLGMLWSQVLDKL